MLGAQAASPDGDQAHLGRYLLPRQTFWAAAIWEGGSHSTLGPLLAGPSQPAWGAWPGGLLTLREPGAQELPL